MKDRQRQELYVKYNKRLVQDRTSNYWKLLKNVVRANFCGRIDYEYLLGLIAKRDFTDLYDYTERLAAQSYQLPWEHFQVAQLFALIKKYPISISGVNPETEARKKFFQNDERIGSITRESLLEVEPFLHVAAGVCQYVLGVEPDLNQILGSCDFGPGASVGVHGNATNVHRKMAVDEITCTPRCFQYAFTAAMGIPSFADSLFPSREYSDGTRIVCIDKVAARSTLLQRSKLIGHKKISFVPKSAKTHRVIAVEPLLNGFVQKGIDVFMRRELLKIQIDLTDQFTNSRLAREGSTESCEDPYVTIDLSSASDSITRALVERLVPSGWLSLFDTARAPLSEIDGELVPLNQFVSMGNGFCFPLQSLIFSALAISSGARVGDFRVYGDDIIVRKSTSATLLYVLRVCGFIPNRAKTFLSGPFRESCGGDYFGGLDVRPLFLDDHLDRLEKIFKFFNGIRASDFVAHFFRDVPLKFFGTPDRLLFVRPQDGPADEAITVELDVYLSNPNSFRSRNTGHFRWPALRFKPVADNFRSPYGSYALLYSALRGGDSHLPFAVRYTSRPVMGQSS